VRILRDLRLRRRRVVKELARKPEVRERRSAEARDKELETEREIKVFGFNTEDTGGRGTEFTEKKRIEECDPHHPRATMQKLEKKVVAGRATC
jgi:hypothetical protein